MSTLSMKPIENDQTINHFTRNRDNEASIGISSRVARNEVPPAQVLDQITIVNFLQNGGKPTHNFRDKNEGSFIPPIPKGNLREQSVYLNVNTGSLDRNMSSSHSLPCTIISWTNSNGNIERELVLRIPLPTVSGGDASVARQVSESSLDSSVSSRSNDTMFGNFVLPPIAPTHTESTPRIMTSVIQLVPNELLVPKDQSRSSHAPAVISPVEYDEQRVTCVENTHHLMVPSSGVKTQTAKIARNIPKKRKLPPLEVLARDADKTVNSNRRSSMVLSELDAREAEAADVLQFLSKSQAPKQLPSPTKCHSKGDSDGESEDPRDTGSNVNKVYVEPTPNDVLLGRGGRTNKHNGNRMYLQAKCDIQGRYIQAQKDEKTQISQTLVNMVKGWGGRFLKLDEKKNIWYEVPNSIARKKASQTLREVTAAPTERTSSKRAKLSLTAAAAAVSATAAPVATTTSATAVPPTTSGPVSGYNGEPVYANAVVAASTSNSIPFAGQTTPHYSV